jgi:hypothetical protein
MALQQMHPNDVSDADGAQKHGLLEPPTHSCTHSAASATTFTPNKLKR